MAELYRLFTEADFTETSKVTGSGQAQAWDGAALPYGAAKWTIANTNAVYAEATYSAPTAYHRLGFYLNADGLATTSGNVFNIIHVRSSSVHTDRLYEIRLYHHPSNGLSIGLLSYEEGATNSISSYATILSGVNWYEVLFTRSLGVGQANASVQMFTGQNLTQIISRTSFTNYTSFGLVTKISMGGIEGIDAGTTGTLTLGNIKITNDANPIGPFLSYRHRPRPAAIMKKRQRIKGHRCG